ncbi:MAG TPA: PAS domain-containing protein [Candidatus Sulfotelmatobacter sp.]|nr:PAS domain-containing protein [Candidatus Sulfotelmatobacter sp.]
MSVFEESSSIGSRTAPSKLEYDFRRLLRRASIELVIALGLPLLILLLSVSSLVYFTHQVNHSDQVLARINRAVALVETMESNLQGYSMTMQKDYLTNCIEARAELDPTMADAEKLVADNRDQEALAVQFHSQADDWIKYLDGSLDRLGGKKKARVNLPGQIQASQNRIAAPIESAETFMDNEATLREERYGWFGKSLVLTAVIFLLLACTVIPVVLYRHRMALRQVSAMYNTSLQHLAQEEWRSRNALALGAAGSLACDLRKGLVTGDLMLSKTLGIPLEDCEKGFPVAWLMSAVNKQDQARLYADVFKAVRHNKTLNGEYRVIDVSGREHWFQGRGRIERDARGKAVRMFGFLIDITDRKRAEIALVESTERFRLFTAVVEMNIWTANPNGELDYANEQSVAFFGNRDVLGRSWFNYVHPDDKPRVQRVWEESVKTGAPYEIEMRLRSGTGEYRWFLTRARCMRDAQGKIERWFGATADIDALKKAQQSALDANRAKDVFLAALSHELRNPLNPAMLVASAEAENPELSESVRSNFSVILNNIEMESRLIDDLLDLTRISTGKLSLRRQVVDIQRIFMDALASVHSDQLGKHITLTVDWSAQNNDVNGDPLRLRQIFWNILKNAVKFTPPDGIVRVNASNAESHVIIKVTDTGIGIRPEEMSRLFNPFAQGDHAGKTGSQVYGGLGLGLAIAKNLTDMHSGSINAESEGANKGSTFTVELPLAA